MQHRHEQALALAERSVELQRGVRHAARPRRRAGVAGADLRAGRESQPRGGGAEPRPRRPQPDAVHARDDRRRLRHARPDSPDSRRASRRRPARSYEAQGCLRRVRDPDGALVSVVAARAGGARWRSAAGRRAPRWRWRNDIASMEGIPAVYAILGELIAIEALLATGASGECQERLESVAAAHQTGHDERDLGRVPAASRPRARGRRAAPPTRTTTSARASASSSCSASAIRPGSAIWSSAGWPRLPAPDRARPAI